MNQKVHCRSLSSIHILYNYSPTARLRPHPELCCGFDIFNWTRRYEVVLLSSACVMLSLTVPYKAGHHTLGRVCVGEGLGSEEGYFMGRTGGGRGGKGARWARVAVGGRHAVRNQASMIPPPPTRKELLRPSSRVCCTCYRNMVEHTRATQHAKITI